MRAHLFMSSVAKEAPIAFLVLLLVAMAVARIGFYNPSNIYSLCYAVSLSVPVAIGVQLLLVTGYFDLSIGAVAALSSVVAALVANNTDSVLLGFAAAIAVGICAGLINGIAVTGLKVHCLIATIATLGLLRTFALTANDGMVIAGLPNRFMWLARHQTMGIEFPIILSSLLVIVFSFLSVNAVAFRRFYQVGSNPLSAEICGLRTSRIVRIAFVLCAIGASITGILGASRTMAASPIGSESLGLDVIAACVIGGSNLRGGTGSIWGALTGLLIVQIVSTAVILLGVSLYWRYGVVGVILITAIVLNQAFKKRIDVFAAE